MSSNPESLADIEEKWWREKYHDGEYQYLPKDSIERYKNRFVWGSDGGPIMTQEKMQWHSGNSYNQKELDAYVTQELLQELIVEIRALRTALKAAKDEVMP